MNWIYILCVLAASVIAEEYFEREKRAPGRNCPRITNFPGRVKYKRRGTRAQFRCTKTFIRYGNKAVNCRSDNTWSGEPPICLSIPSDCQTDWFQIMPDTTFVGPNLGPNCLQRLSADDTKRPRVYSPAEWSLTMKKRDLASRFTIVFFSFAEAGCVPIDIAAYHKLDMKEMYGGALLSFSCEDEFQLMGPDQIYCDSKTWSDVPPVCKATAQLTECDFEQGLCGWSQDDSDDLNWTQHQGQTSTGGTGPKTDHTLQTISGHYMFVESSNPARNGDQARLLSPLYPADMGNMCFEFWYHLLGPADPGHVGTLEVFIRGDFQFLDDLQPVFVKGGNQGDDWKRGEVYIDKQDEPYQIAIVTTRKLSYISDIAIDDVRLYNCSDTKTTSTTTTTKTTLMKTLSTTQTPSVSSITSHKPPISTPSLRTPSQTSKSSTSTKIKPSSVTASMSTFIASSGAVTQSTSTKTVHKTSPIATTLISSSPTSKRQVSTTISKAMSTPTVALTTKGAAHTTKGTTSSSQNETPEATKTRVPSTTVPTTSKTPTTKTSLLSSTERSSEKNVPSSAASTSSALPSSTSSPIPPSTSIATSTTRTSIPTTESTKGSTQLHTSTVSSRSSLSTTQRGLPASTSNNARTTRKTTLLLSTTIPGTTIQSTPSSTTMKRSELTSVQSTTQSSTITLQKSQSTTATKRTRKTKVTKWKDHTTTPRKTTAVNTNKDLYKTKPPVGSRTTAMIYVNETEPAVVIAEQRSQHPEDETLKPLMIGLGVGIVAGLIIIGIVAWVCVRRRKFYTSRYEDELKPITKSSSSENFNNIQYEYHDDEFQ